AILAPLAALPVYVLISRPSARRLVTLGSVGALLVIGAGLVLAQRYGDILGKPFDETSRVYLAQLGKLDPDAPRHAYALSIVNQAWLFMEYGARWVAPYAGWMSINMRPPFPLTWLSFPQAFGILAYPASIVGGAFLLIRYRDWRALAGLSILVP